MAPDKEVERPLKAAGGGAPTEEATKARVRKFKADGPTHKHLKKIFEQHAKDETFQDGRKLSDEDSFMEYMRSPAVAALKSPPEVDVSHPLSSYYISSSHNTYLTGHQLYGDATTEGYTNVLKRGCRCLEIDIWDGDDSDSSASSSDEEVNTGTPKKSRWSRMKAKAAQIRGASPSKDHDKQAAADPANAESLAPHHHQKPLSHSHGHATDAPQPFKPEPQVVHGWTLTQAIPFRTVCAAIRDSAFTATDLPLIVSLETHASLEQQETMVEIMKEAWGEYLVDMGDATKTGFGKLPSPDSLRNKILVKVKWSPGFDLVDTGNTLETVDTNTTESSAEGAPAKKKPSKMLPALSELGMFTRAFSFKNWAQPEASIPTHVFSLTESKAHRLHPDPLHGPAMFKHNKSFLTRIYPKATRIGSSNYDPVFHWRHGAQMVALNWQKLDKGMMLNEGMFAGYEGWVLKPDGYRGEELQPAEPTTALKSSSEIVSSIPKKQIMELKIQIFSGENLPVPRERDASHAARLKPCVKFELHVDTHGPPGQGKNGENLKTDADVDEEDKKEREKHKRRSKTQKTDSPDFEGESVSWTNVDVVEKLSFIR